jgi:cysteine dioxygenase
VRIIRGMLTNTDFDRVSAGYIKATGSHELSCGSICALQDDDIHQVANLQPPGCDLVTLHIYSPPLVKMNVYSLSDAQPHFEPAPVFTGLHGEGI